MCMWRRWLSRRLDGIEAKLDRLLIKERRTMAQIDDLTNAVAAQKSVDDSIATLLDNIAQQLKDALANNNTTAIQQIITDLQNNTSKVQAAITKNTPVTPTDTAATT